MKINFGYLDNSILISDDVVTVLEIENKKLFYRIVNDLNFLSNGFTVSDINCYDELYKEILLSNKIRIYFDFFNFNFDSKKYSNDLNKYIVSELSEEDKNDIQKIYNKLVEKLTIILNKFDLPLQIMNDMSFDKVIKNLDVVIDSKNDLLQNLMLLIELENIFRTNNILFFINLKQYLCNTELVELYKYAIYNQVKIILIDSQAYGIKLNYEKKMIIDDNLDEFML